MSNSLIFYGIKTRVNLMAALVFDASSWTDRTEAVKIVCNALFLPRTYEKIHCKGEP